MALDAAHRSSIYNKLLPLLGEDDANALMSEFPSVEAQELVTKDFLRAQLAELRSELRSELHSEIGSVRAELRSEIGSVRAELAALETKLTVRLGAAIAASTVWMTGLNLLV